MGNELIGFSDFTTWLSNFFSEFCSDLFGNFSFIISSFQRIIEYLSTLIVDLFSFFEYFQASDEVFFKLVNYMPSIIRLCAVVVVGISVVKIIFGR